MAAEATTPMGCSTIAPMSVSVQYGRHPVAPWYRSAVANHAAYASDRKSLTTKLSGGTAVVSQLVNWGEISLESRILGLVADFQQRVTQLHLTLSCQNICTSSGIVKQQGELGSNLLTPWNFWL